VSFKLGRTLSPAKASPLTGHKDKIVVFCHVVHDVVVNSSDLSKFHQKRTARVVSAPSSKLIHLCSSKLGLTFSILAAASLALLPQLTTIGS